MKSDIRGFVKSKKKVKLYLNRVGTFSSEAGLHWGPVSKIVTDQSLKNI